LLAAGADLPGRAVGLVYVAMGDSAGFGFGVPQSRYPGIYM
jgi:hypothetical protein